MEFKSGRFLLTQRPLIESVADVGGGEFISTTDWGNLLFWKDEKVRFEIRRKDGTKCHNGAIHQLVAEEGELITIGTFARLNLLP